MTLHVMVGSSCCLQAMLTAKACNLPVTFKYYTSEAERQSEKFMEMNPSGELPCLQTSEGVITNSEAILRYMAGCKAYLYVAGQSAFDKAQVDYWMASCRSDLASVNELKRIVNGKGAWAQADLDNATASLTKALARFEEHLALRTYFVGHSVTLADLCFAATLAANRSTLLREDQMRAFPNVLRHFNFMTQTTFFQAVMGRSFAPMKTSLPLADSEKCKEFGSAPVMVKDAVCDKGKKPQGEGKGKKGKDQPKKKAEPKEKEVNEDEPPKAPKVELTEEQKKAGGWFYDFKTHYANATNKNDSIDKLWAEFDEIKVSEHFSFWCCLYDKLPTECLEQIKTNNLLSFFFRGFEGTNKDMLAVHGMYGKPECHDLKGVWMWKGTEMHQGVKDHSSCEYYNFQKMDMTLQANRDKLREYWTNTTNEEGSVEGQMPLSVKVWK